MFREIHNVCDLPECDVDISRHRVQQGRDFVGSRCRLYRGREPVLLVLYFRADCPTMDIHSQVLCAAGHLVLVRRFPRHPDVLRDMAGTPCTCNNTDNG